MKQKTHLDSTARATRKAPSRLRLMTLIAAALLGLFCVYLTSAVPSHEIERVYFNAAGQTIGGSILTCNSGYFAWGTTSEYEAELTTSCNGAGSNCICTYQGIAHPCPSAFNCQGTGGL